MSLPVSLSAPTQGLSLAQLPRPLPGECIMLGKAVNPLLLTAQATVLASSAEPAL